MILKDNMLIKRFLYIFAWVIELAALAGMYACDHFARAKLGMNRWLVYHNQHWEQELPLDVLKAAAIVVTALLLIAAIVLWIRKRRSGYVSRLGLASIVLGAVMGVFLVAVMLTYNSTTLRAYYLICAIAAIACMVQGVKAVAINACGPKAMG